VIDIEIRRPKIKDIKQVNEFFITVIVDTFNKEGIGDLVDDLANEIEIKEKYLESDLESNGEKRYFLIALDGDKIIGSIEFGPASDLISDHTNGDSKELIEVGTVFVHPDYQRNGVGNLLLKNMFLTLKNKGIDEFYLDSGYRNAQKIWRKKFGEPDRWLKDYWGKEFDHLIWKIRVSDWVNGG
jgi:N-acetylglutamate synthase-like GNAT family acetyltransferase